jgi:polyvinyl alcohol dehydrogenase (cytochrome)
MCFRRLASAALIWLLIAILASQPTSASQANQADWPMWGYNLSNHRYNANERTITPANVGTLKLRWAFVFPDTMIASSQPTVIGDTVYVGSYNGSVYALDTATGRQRWAFSTNITGQPGGVRVGVVLSQGIALFGDQLGRFFGVNRDNGTMAWLPAQLSDHPLAQITGSPVAYGERVYVPIASREENAAADPAYPCCTFRGGLAALNVSDGSVAWHFYTTGQPARLGVNSAGATFSGPSGVGIWSTPAIDPDEGLIYVSTGNSYSPPVSPYSDAILAINLKDGTLRWATQLVRGDWANGACGTETPGPNCEGEHGGDFDFGSAPLLMTVQTPNGPRKLVSAMQKNGTFYTLDALTGKVIWRQKLAKAIAYPWGASYDGRRLYMADTSYDTNGGIYALDPATGAVLWHTGPFTCVPGPEQPAAACWSGYMAAAVTTPGLLWLGTMDGQMRALDSASGKVLWSYNTAQAVQGVNGLSGHGGSIGPTNATVANGQVYVMSGYAKWNARIMDGNVLYVFGLGDH